MSQTLAFHCFFLPSFFLIFTYSPSRRAFFLFASLNCQLLLVPSIELTLNYQLSTINYQLSPINCQLSTLNYQLSTITYQPSTITYQPSTVTYQPSTITYQPSTVNPQLSTVNSQLTSIPNRKITKQIRLCFMNTCIKK